MSSLLLLILSHRRFYINFASGGVGGLLAFSHCNGGKALNNAARPAPDPVQELG